jgi:hypothetical protein
MNVMKRWLGALCGLALVLAVATPALAQQHAAQPGAGGQAGQMPMQGGGMQGGGMMMCPMMSGMMGGGMPKTGMMGGDMMGGGGMMGMMGGQMDPKMMGRMLQMRGEIMKAVADVLIKHGKAMEAQPAK